MFFAQIPWQLLPAAVSAVSTGIQAATSRPRKSEFQQRPEYIKRYRSMIQDEISNRNVFRNAITPALRAIGRQARQTREDVEQSIQAGGQEGTGVATLSRLQAGQQAISGAERVGEQIAALQSERTERLQGQLRQAELLEGRARERASQRYRRALREWGANLAQGVVNVGAQAAGGIQQMQAAQQAGIGVLESLKAEGVVPMDTDYEQFQQQMEEAGFTQEEKFAQFKINEAQREAGIQPETVREMFPGTMADAVLQLSPEEQQRVIRTEVNRRREETLGQAADRRSQMQTRVNEIQRKYGDEAGTLLQQMGFEQPMGELIRENIVDPDRLEFMLENTQRQRKQQKQRQFYRFATQNADMPTGQLMEQALGVFGNPEEARRQVAAVKSGLSDGGIESEQLRDFRLNIVEPLGGLSEEKIKQYGREFGVDEDKAVSYYKTFRQTQKGDPITRAARTLRQMNFEPRNKWEFDASEVKSQKDADRKNAETIAGILTRTGQFTEEEVRSYISTRYGPQIARTVMGEVQQPQIREETGAPPGEQGPPEAEFQDETTEPAEVTEETQQAQASETLQINQQLERMKEGVIQLGRGRYSMSQLEERLRGESPAVKMEILRRALELLQE